MELFTPLVALKRIMNGGTLPPMMPVPESAHALIDPTFTIGLGALDADETRGLRCPIRGCGGYFHDLRKHLDKGHRGVGGSAAVRRALSIPETAALVSDRLRATRKDRTQQLVAAGRLRPFRHGPDPKRRSTGNRGKRTKSTVGFKNLRDACERQLAHKLIDLQTELGRSPSQRDAIAVYGTGFVQAVEATFGTWNAAKALHGMAALKRARRYTVEEVLESLSAYYAAHKQLPSYEQAHSPHRAPLVPSDRAIARALGEPGDKWWDIMRKAARMLGIRDGRYGLQPLPDMAAD